jgi:hypothetical protein
LEELQQSPEEIEKQNGRIRSIYRRRVMFPTADMLFAWNEYDEWETDREEFNRVKERHEAAKLMLDAWVNFEEKFQEAF